jgi:hypothetical protein
MRPLSSLFRFRLGLLAALVAGAASSGGAVTLTLSTADSTLPGLGLNQGWWHASGSHLPFNADTTTSGLLGYRSFYLFDLGSVGSGTITSATLRIFHHASNALMGPGPWNVGFYDITSDPLQVKTAWTSPTIYQDLGSGVSYGSGSFNTLGGYATFQLNAAALTALNTHGTGFFGIGAALLSPGVAFSFTTGEITYLELQVTPFSPPPAMAAPVPDHGSPLALASGLLLVFVQRIRR